MKFLIDAFEAGFKAASITVGAPSISKMPAAPAAPVTASPVIATQTAAVAPKPLPKTSVPQLPSLTASGKVTVGGTSSAARDGTGGASVTQAPNPPASVAQLHTTNTAVTNMAKQSDLHHDSTGLGAGEPEANIMRRQPPDNGELLIGAKPPDYSDAAYTPDNTNQSINSAFNDLVTSKSVDTVNDINRTSANSV